MTDQLRPNFWEQYSLEELNSAEWEALCDGCGKCCLVKLEDEDTGEIAYTRLSCQLLDCTTGSCQQYATRKNIVPDCLSLTPKLVKTLNWLPETCAYSRLANNRPLPEWHYLVTGNRDSVKMAGHSVAGRCMNERLISPDDVEEYIVKWIK